MSTKIEKDIVVGQPLNLYALLIAILADLTDIKAIYDAHTHECPGSTHAASRCSTPDTGAAENSLAASAASATTITLTS